MRIQSLIVGAIALLLAVPALAQQTTPIADRKMSVEDARESLNRAIAFLLKDQNGDGSWGGPRNAVWTFTGWVWSNPETHRAWKAATTGLCAYALMESDKSEGGSDAARKGIDYLLAEAADVKRPSEWDTMNSWAYIYAIQALAAAHRNPMYSADAERKAKIKQVAEKFAKRLGESQSVQGGWGYLEFEEPHTEHQQWATSFTTAAGVVALAEAKKEGFAVDEKMFERATRAVEHCRLPSGAYTYSINVIPSPGGSTWIDQVNGSLSRMQVCNEALLCAGRSVTVETLRDALGAFFREHRFLDIARNRPVPHQAYYFNSGYFYLFGHYYASRVIDRLPKEEREKNRERLRYEVAKIQQADGSMWDYDMHAYHKPYGTAFSVLALNATLGE